MTETRTIEDVTETLIDYRGKTPEKVKRGVVLITAKVIKDGRILDDKHEYISEESYDSWMRRGLPKLNDILITTEAPLGEVAKLKKTARVALAQRVILLRGNPTLIDQDYYFHALQSPFVKAELSKRATGTTVLGIKQSELRKVQIPYFPLSIQRRITAILSAYDDLIENNTRRIQILEEISRRIYEEWFVRFRFPGSETVKMRNPAEETLPEGWSIKTLSDFGKVVTGKTPSKGDSENFGLDVPFLKLPDMHRKVFCINTSEHLSNKGADSQSSKFIPPNSLCVSCIGTAGIVNINAVECQTNQQINSLIPAHSHHREFLYFSLIRLREVINRYGATGATMVNLNKAKFESLPVIHPEEEIVENYNEITYPMFEEILNLQKQNEILSGSRDLLLPKLISGRIDVSAFPEPETL